MHDIQSKNKFIDFLINEVNSIEINDDNIQSFDEWIFDIDNPQACSFSKKDKTFYKIHYDSIVSVFIDDEGTLNFKTCTEKMKFTGNVQAHMHYILIMAYSFGKHKTFHDIIRERLYTSIKIDRDAYDIIENRLEIT